MLDEIFQLVGYKDFDDFFNWKWLQDFTRQTGYTIGIFVWFHLILLIYRTLKLPIALVAVLAKRQLTVMRADSNRPT